MRSTAGWLIGLLGSPLGILLLAALDSTFFFSLPGGIDAAIVFVAARGQHAVSWLAVGLAVAGSLAGAWVTFWTGKRIGEHGLDRHISGETTRRDPAPVRNAGASRLAALDLLPPPFPFTAFILAGGALGADARTFFSTLAACRVLRFGGEALLATIYGRQILRWMGSDLFRDTAIAASVVGVGLTTLSIVRIVASSRRDGRSKRGAAGLPSRAP